MTAAPDVLTADDVAATQELLRDTYGTARADTSRVLVADGYGITLDVRDGQLVVRDGIGQHRRTRTLPRIERRVRRIVVLGSTGTLSLAAVRWCADVGIDLVQLDRDGELLATVHAESHTDARLIRAQAMSVATGLATALASDMLRTKITGHAVNADRLGADRVASSLRDMAELVGTLDSSAELRELEARAADIYFSAWVRLVSAQFAQRDRARVPEHWTYFAGRTSMLSGKNKSPSRATDPVNALLNYAYALGESECRRACLILGLEPTLGMLHNDARGRDSLALDLLETIRPTIEAAILDMLAVRRFRYADLIETPEGQCRLTESVTHELAKHLPLWADAVAPHAEAIAHALTEAATGVVTKRTPLTKANRLASAGKRKSATTPAVKAPRASCEGCGTTELRSGRKWCDACWSPHRRELATIAAATMTQARQSKAFDPAQTAEARVRRSASLSRERAERDAWNAAHPEPVDPTAYEREILPALAGFPISSIEYVTGVSSSAASRIKRGLMTPHPRHWVPLAELVSGSVEIPTARKNQYG